MAAFFPLSRSRAVHRRSRPMQLLTEAGVVKLEVPYGQDATDQHWGCPIRERWGLTSHQQLSLALEDKLAFTITATASYEEAAALAQKWGVAVTDSLLHSLTQRLGARERVSPMKGSVKGSVLGFWYFIYSLVMVSSFARACRALRTSPALSLRGPRPALL